MILLAIYCALILLASLLGGWLPLMVRLTHTRLQVATSFVAGLMLGVAVLHLVPHAWGQFRSADLTLADYYVRHLSWMGAAFGLTVYTLLDGVALAASVELDRCEAHAHGLLGLGTLLVIFLHKPFDALAVGTLLAVRNSSRSLRHWVNGLFALANPAG